MTDADPKKKNAQQDDLSKLADQSGGNIALEFWDFLKTNKKWWLLPILIVLSIVGLIAILSGSVVAPFIYPIG